MAREQIVAGLDVGSGVIKILVVRSKGNGWEVLSYVERPSFGLRKGAVMDAEEVQKRVRLLVSSAEQECGRKINSAVVNIGGSHLYAMPSDGLISVSRADQIISEEDVERVLQATKAVNIPKNEEILDVFPREYIIDDQRGIKQPVGLVGVRLQAKVLLLCYFQSYFMNLTQAVLASGVQIDDIVPSVLASAKAVLTPQQKEMGVALIDMGAQTTSLAVFEEGDLIHLAVFPLGAGSITNDIAIGLKTEVPVAEEIKKQYGACFLNDNGIKKSNEKQLKKIDFQTGGSNLSFTKKDLVSIIEPRVSEILELMQKELKKIGRQELLPGGVVLVGGGANLPKIKDLAKKQLKLTCQIGVPQKIIGLEKDPSLSSVAGLVLEGAEQNLEGNSWGSAPGILEWLSSAVKKLFKAFKP